MRLLIIAPRFHTNLYYNVIALQNNNHKVKVFVLNKGKSEYYENIDLYQFKLSKVSKFLFWISKLFNKTNLISTFQLRIQFPGKKFKSEIIKYKPDVILLKSYQDLLAIKTLLIAKKHNIKVLMMTQTEKTHILGSKKLFDLNIKLFKKLKVHAYITPVYNNYLKFINLKITNIFYIPFIFPVKSELPDTIINYKTNNIFKIMCIGKYTPRKNHILLIKAVESLKNQYKLNSVLNIYGEISDVKYFENLKTYLITNNLEETVKLHLNKDYQYICSQYTQHHLFVLPSNDEPAAYSIVESICQGIPAICSSDNGTKHYITNNFNGFVFERNNLEDLIVKIKICINDDNLSKFSKNCIDSVKINHNPDNFSDKIINIVNNL